ncbi:type II toxin-antitoxin system RnlA family toxin [Clostridium sporogenes]|uniref:type II toxin-antitoxin system RnlA family toxin n=1 Tax=Clostridium sporogenes TaxID=1509 RepID=UPI000DDA987B|nr:type II toxin-antitoxin system RnlA family toxin [Clostridium sporogenes]
MKKKLAYFIKNDDDCKIGDDSKNKWFVAKNIENSDLKSILELVEESEYYKKTIEKKECTYKTLYKYKGKYNEDLTIEYYNTKTLVIKGKPLLLFNEVMVIIGELIDLDDMPKTFNNYYNVGIKKDEILSQYEIIMPNSYGKPSL